MYKLKNFIYIKWYKNDEYRNPWYYLNKSILKKSLRKCPFKIHIGKYHYMMFADPIHKYLIELLFTGLGWKYAGDFISYITPPNILFKFFNYEIRIVWTLGDWNTDKYYWEEVLSYKYGMFK